MHILTSLSQPQALAPALLILFMMPLFIASSCAAPSRPVEYPAGWPLSGVSLVNESHAAYSALYNTIDSSHAGLCIEIHQDGLDHYGISFSNRANFSDNFSHLDSQLRALGYTGGSAGSASLPDSSSHIESWDSADGKSTVYFKQSEDLTDGNFQLSVEIRRN